MGERSLLSSPTVGGGLKPCAVLQQAGDPCRTSLVLHVTYFPPPAAINTTQRGKKKRLLLIKNTCLHTKMAER